VVADVGTSTAIAAAMLAVAVATRPLAPVHRKMLECMDTHCGRRGPEDFSGNTALICSKGGLRRDHFAYGGGQAGTWATEQTGGAIVRCKLCQQQRETRGPAVLSKNETDGGRERGVPVKFLDGYPKPDFMMFARNALSLASTAKLRRSV
jgi:hypothetical protein